VGKVDDAGVWAKVMVERRPAKKTVSRLRIGD